MNLFYIGTIEARKRITTDFEFVSTGIYKISVSDYNFLSLKVDSIDGIALDEMVVVGDVLYSYYEDRVNKELYVRLDPSDLSDDKNFIMTHVLAFTNDKDMYLPIDFSNPLSKEILFQSRFTAKPRFAQTQTNNLVGILTTSLTSIVLSNVDQFYNKYFTYKDSFKDAVLKVWECDTLPENRTPYYKGLINRAVISDRLDLSLTDFFRRLENVYYSNFDYSRSLATSQAGTFRRGENKIIPRLIGTCTSFRIRSAAIDELASFRGPYEFDSLIEATNHDYIDTSSSITNRDWYCAFVESASVTNNFTITSVSSVTLDGIPLYLISINETSNNLSVGDCFYIAGSPNKYYRIVLIDGVGSYYTTESILGAPTVGQTIIVPVISSVIWYNNANNEHYETFYKRDYEIIDHGNSLYGIKFNFGFEANIGAPNLDPNTDRIYIKARRLASVTDSNHGRSIKNLLLTEFAVSEINETSFNSPIFNLNLCYQLPFNGESFVSKKDILQKMLTSTMGFIYLDSDFKIAYGNYQLSDNIVATEKITDTEIELNSISHEIDYEDVYESVNFNNPYFGYNIRMRDEGAGYLHKTNKTYDLITITDIMTASLTSIINNHLFKILSYFTMPKTKTSLNVLYLPARLGQNKIIESRKQLNYSSAIISAMTEGGISSELDLVNLKQTDSNIFISLNGNTEVQI